MLHSAHALCHSTRLVALASAPGRLNAALTHCTPQNNSTESFYIRKSAYRGLGSIPNRMTSPLPRSEFPARPFHSSANHDTFTARKEAVLANNHSRVALLGVVAAVAASLSWYLSDPSVEAETDLSTAYFLAFAARGDLEQLKKTANEICGTGFSSKSKLQSLVNSHHDLGWTALHAAACNNHIEVVKWLIENGADPKAKDRYNPADTQNPIMAARIRASEFSDYVNPRLDTRGWSPLHYAVAFGNVALAKYLIEHGADPEQANMRGHVPRKYIDSTTQEGRLMEKMFQESEGRLKELQKAERVKYPLEQKLKEVMVAQVMPIDAVAAAIRRRQNGWHDEDKPLVLLFLGSSGVGKTMLAKCIAEYLVKDYENGFIRIDMSEYSSQHEVSKFIGAPPGYVGYNEGGQLTERLKKCPNAVVLLDEVEKAHRDVLTVMLQVFDEGRLTDGQGNTVDCRNAIFIMTSNLVQDEIHDTSYKIRPSHTPRRSWSETGEVSVNEDQTLAAEKAEVQRETKTFLNLVVQPILKRHFKRDEFLGRINEMVIFHPFTEEDLEEIVNSELHKWKVRALKRHNIAIKWDKNIVGTLTEGYNVSYGFRSIKHEVEKRVINVIAAAYERDEIKEGMTANLSLAEDGATVKLKTTK